MKTIRSLALLITIISLIGFSPYARGQNADEIGKLFEKINWRCVGPAVMGGRTVDIDVVEKTPWIIYAAIGPSGVWKSVNNGITWAPVFHKESTVSVGDIAIVQSQPKIIWVGTGEATSRNSITIGDGVYKSMDSGKSWENMGLKETRHISRIVVDHQNPAVVYVAAMGHLWGSNEERGIYKTTDGGETWQKILYVNQDTGFSDLAIDPSDNRILYAAAYEHRRFPYYFYSGGPGSGLYKTIDGGITWQKLTKDLPEGIMGRIGIDVSRSQPNVVYALIEHEDGGIWRSEDKGETWTRTCDKKTYDRVNFRPFYYSQIRVDPSDDKVVYVFSGGSFVSKDMGKKFISISRGTHPDHHALWIDPTNPLHLIDGNDGGIDISYDGGKNWQAIQHMALAEVYQIGFDMRNPYYVYCGLQDNGSWGGPSSSLDSAGIMNDDWYSIGGGDGFYAQVDPTDPNTMYRNYQMNGLSRYDMRIGRGKTIRPQASLKDPPYRFNWNSPILISPHDPKTVYNGGNFLFKTMNGGQSWEVISPDLSTNDPEKQKDSGGPITLDNTGAEIHCTIITISESPIVPGIIWCGTDDGNVQVTRNSGRTWKNVVENIPDLPPNTWCSRIESSHFSPGTAYVAFDGHRMDDYDTYVYKTTDYGETWTSIKGNLPFGWVHVIREDLKNKNLLYVGTEFGVYASLDGGESWFTLRNNLPTVAVRDIAVHPRENDLIIGTHGRGIWILDDISPLQEMTREVFDSNLHLFNIRPTTQFLRSARGESYSSKVYAAKNPTYGMILHAYFKTKPEEKPKVLIKDKKGETIFKIDLMKKEGIQRKAWNLQYVPKTKDGKTIAPIGMGFIAAPFVSPGEYTVEMTVGEQTVEKKGLVYPDPRFWMVEKDRILQSESMVEVMVLSRKMSLSVTGTRNVKNKLNKLEKTLSEKSDTKEAVRKAVERFEEKFSGLEKDILPKEFNYRGSVEMALRGGALNMLVMMLGMSISEYPSAPTETDLAQLRELTDEVNKIVDLFNEFIQTEIPRLNEILEKNGIEPLKAPKEVKV
jgi:photosystem II stability/assembly factor-like uncharacterized protein